ncbi:hypothetical protein BDZ91DRAFT_723510 [Kalaharituber pfeilii]|nr:hypothetical protein BDZ91DRAFT_723510 [Kalaharituber pfeilii]
MKFISLPQALVENSLLTGDNHCEGTKLSTSVVCGLGNILYALSLFLIINHFPRPFNQTKQPAGPYLHLMALRH